MRSWAAEVAPKAGASEAVDPKPPVEPAAPNPPVAAAVLGVPNENVIV